MVQLWKLSLLLWGSGGTSGRVVWVTAEIRPQPWVGRQYGSGRFQHIPRGKKDEILQGQSAGTGNGVKRRCLGTAISSVLLKD